jgi:hypothetical protein
LSILIPLLALAAADDQSQFEFPEFPGRARNSSEKMPFT